MTRDGDNPGAEHSSRSPDEAVSDPPPSERGRGFEKADPGELATSLTEPAHENVGTAQNAPGHLAAQQANWQSHYEAAWGLPSPGEHRWPAALAVLVAIGLEIALPTRIVQGLGPRALLPVLEAALLVAIFAANPGRITKETIRFRWLSFSLIVVINVVNFVTLGELINALLYNSRTGGRALVYAAIPVWLTNVIVFALWYWELDRGGPAARRRANHRAPDWLFTQMQVPGSAPRWHPTFVDYLYLSFTNATAFSPTDTMPLTDAAKALMTVQSFASLLTVVIVVSRAVGIISG